MADGTVDGAPRAGDSPKVWVTLITNKEYLPGLLTLDHSLKKVGSRYPLVAIYTDQFPEEGHKALDERGIPKRRVTYVNPSTQKDYSNDPRFYDTWTKLTAFSLTEYERVILLDGDMLALQNMDELMDLPLDAPSLQGQGSRVFAASPACCCNPAKKAHYPKDWNPSNCAFTLQHADPDKAQTEGSSMKGCVSMLNSGLLNVVPSAATYDMISKKMEDSEAMQKYDFPDQALLSDVFMHRWVVLPYVYNALKTLRWDGVHTAIWRDDRVKNVHYIWSPKPWNQKPGDGQDETDKWWHKVHQERKEAERSRGIDDAF